MKALRFHGREDVRIDEVEEPPPGALGPKDVLVEGRACGICGTDVIEYSKGPRQTSADPHPLTPGGGLPQILGHEAAGRVLEVGDQVEGLKSGDRVSIMPMTFCGECPPCKDGLHQLCEELSTVGYHTRWGGFSERLVVREDQAALLPDSVSDAAGALVEPAAVAVTAVEAGEVEDGDLVLVTGGGPIGQLAALAALAAGARRVLLTRHRPLNGGISEVADIELIDPATEDLQARLLALSDGVGADVVFECTGRASGLKDALAGARHKGVVVEVGASASPLPLETTPLLRKDLTLRGSMCYPSDSWPRIIEMIRSGALPVELIVSSSVSLEDAVDRGIKRLLQPDNDETKIVVTTAAEGGGG